jgi:hypothetical protein
MRQIGFGVGIAGLGAVFGNSIASGIARGATDDPEVAARGRELANMVAGGDLRGAAASLPPGSRASFVAVANESVVGGLVLILIVAAVVALAAAALAFALVRSGEVPAKDAEPPLTTSERRKG